MGILSEHNVGNSSERYRIEVKIDIKATNETQTNDIQVNNDSFSIIINNSDAESIDKIEKACSICLYYIID